MGAAALFAGAIYPLGFAPFKSWVIPLVSAVFLYIAIQNAATARRAFLWAWLFGVGKYAVGTSWIYVSIHVHGQAPIPVALMLVAVFVGGMALFSGAYGWCWFSVRTGRPVIDVMSFVSIWALGEWLLTWLFTGFPWLFIGYALLDTPLASLAPIGGVVLVGVAGLVSAVCVFEAWKRCGCSAVLARSTPLQPQQHFVCKCLYFHCFSNMLRGRRERALPANIH